jgi:hypothetical protein
MARTAPPRLASGGAETQATNLACALTASAPRRRHAT